MRNRIGRGLIAIAISAAMLPAVARAEEAPGPAFVDELGSQLQPIRDDGAGDRAQARNAGLSLESGSVAVDVIVSGDPAAAAKRLAEAGLDVAAIAEEPRPVVEGRLPLDSIAEVAKLGVSVAVLPVMAYGTDGTDAGAATAEGVTRHNIPAAIAAAGTSGAGIDVGVISDSINRVGGGIADSQATGDLPANTFVIKDGLPGDLDEGRAMAEIIFDEAPGLNRILFASGTNLGPVDKADSINQLVANGSDVIADDIFYLQEPFFQDGVVAKAADAAKAAGVPYFASAGNRARQSYESSYRDSGGKHDFDPGPPTDIRSCFSGTVPTGRFILVALGWDEPVGGVSTDLDLQLTTSAGVPIGTPGLTDNITTGDPKEIASFSNAGPPIQVCVEISRFAGAGTPLMKWIEFDNFTPTPVPEFNTASDTINPDAASAQGALAVAAVNQADPGLDTPESFSSRGPKTRLFAPDGTRLATPLVLAKPQLAAADAVSTTVPGFATFSGTSAAAPSAAGIATILRSANPNATVNEIYAQMTDPANAIDCTSSGLVPDPDCGAGFILADRAVANLDRTGPRIKVRVRPGKKKKGAYTAKKLRVTWKVRDPQSPIESTSGCGPRKIKKKGKTKLTCRAVSGGGPAAKTVKIKHKPKKTRN